MPIRRCSDQANQTLTEFYTQLVEEYDSEIDNAIGKAMLEIIDMINESFPETNLWGLTSLYHLKLLAQDDYRSPWLVSLIGNGNEYYIEYLLPKAKAPWPHAYVKGEAKSLEQVRTYLLIAMRESKGWPESKELNG